MLKSFSTRFRHCPRTQPHPTDKCRSIKPSVLLKRRHQLAAAPSAHTAHLHDLRGLRLGWVSEPSDRAQEYMNAAAVKVLTGGGSVRYQSPERPPDLDVYDLHECTPSHSESRRFSVVDSTCSDQTSSPLCPMPTGRQREPLPREPGKGDLRGGGTRNSQVARPGLSAGRGGAPPGESSTGTTADAIMAGRVAS